MLLTNGLLCGQDYTGSLYPAKAKHYVSLSIGGGEANNFTGRSNSGGYYFTPPSEGVTILHQPQPVITDLIGGGGQIGLGYEVHYKRMFFSVGLSADFAYTRHFVDSLTHVEYINRDIDGFTNGVYEYKFADFAEKEYIVYGSIPIQVGVWLHPYIYAAAGLKIGMSFYSAYTANANMYTRSYFPQTGYMYSTMFDGSGLTPQALENLQTALAARGIYNWDNYSYSESSTDAIHSIVMPKIKVSTTIELGGRIPLHSKKVMLRGGVYAEFGMPLGTSDFIGHEIPDLSAVTIPDAASRVPLSQENLKNNLRFNSLLESNIIGYDISRFYTFTAGIKLVLMFDVTKDFSPCRCAED